MPKQDSIRTQSGRTLEELSLEAILDGRLTTDDFRISAETLQRQAQAAESAGYPQLAENLRRAAELTSISNEKVFEIYSLMRPGRATHQELVALADRMESSNAPRVAALIREAADAYLERGLIKHESSTAE
jgi:propanediol dehydratase small subunit